MATYFVGDLQGCYDELQLLLGRVDFNPTQDKLYLVGDLVARGDKSLECLRFVKSLGDSAQTVLGNHDLHLIATALGIKKVKSRDRVDAIFNAPDFDELIHWLRHQPLLVHSEELNFLMAHAGISPDWNLKLRNLVRLKWNRFYKMGIFIISLKICIPNNLIAGRPIYRVWIAIVTLLMLSLECVFAI